MTWSDRLLEIGLAFAIVGIGNVAFGCVLMLLGLTIGRRP